MPARMSEVPRCRNCYYTLLGLPERRCPECGWEFDPADPSSYTTKPPFIRGQFWLPALVLSFGGGMLAFMFVVPFAGWGWAATLVVPFAAGALLGYAFRARLILLPALATALAISLFIGLVSLSLAGLFCGLVLGGVMFGPIMIGAGAGFLLRQALKNSRFEQRWHLPAVLFLLLPHACALVERAAWERAPAETVETAVVLPVTPERAWDALLFYEDVPGDPPPMFRLGMPRPLYSRGSVGRVGDEKACVYDKGRLVKRVTEIDPGKQLSFKVIEQGFETHAMRLSGGSFRFERAGPGHTRVTLATQYVPHMRPRWCWRPFERWTVHTLHRHVLHGMGEEAERRSGAPRRQDVRVATSTGGPP
jgi:hypothetical protein